MVADNPCLKIPPRFILHRRIEYQMLSGRLQDKLKEGFLRTIENIFVPMDGLAIQVMGREDYYQIAEKDKQDKLDEVSIRLTNGSYVHASRISAAFDY